MALGTPVEIYGNGENAASHTSSSLTPSVGDLWLAFGGALSPNANLPVVTDSLGNSWTNLGGASSSFCRGSCYVWIEPPGTPAARTVTVASTSATQVGLRLVRIAGGRVRLHPDSGVPQVTVNANANGDPSCPISGVDSASTVVGGVAKINTGAFTEAGGYTELGESNVGASLRMATCYDAGSPGTCSWSSSNAGSVGIAVEVEEAPSGQPIAKRLGGVPFMALNRGVW